MTSSDDYVSSSSSSDYSYYNDPAAPSVPADAHVSVNNNIWAATIVLLFLAVFVLSSLQIYAKWLLRRRQSLNRRHAADAEATAPGGLDKATISLLPTFMYKVDDAGEEDDGHADNYNLLECAVCLSEFQENEKGRILPSCKHSFHVECIDMWFYSHSTCPLCRTVVEAGAIDITSPLPSPLMEEQGQRQVQVISQEEASENHNMAALMEEQGQRQVQVISQEEASENHNMAALSAASTTAVGHGVPAYPSAVLVHDHQTLYLLNPNLPHISSSIEIRPSPSSFISPTTTFVPHITIEIPTRQDYDMPSPSGCLSLSSRRSCRSSSPSEQASSTSLKSPGLRVSLKRMLSSKGKRFSCTQEDVL